MNVVAIATFEFPKRSQAADNFHAIVEHIVKKYGKYKVGMMWRYAQAQGNTYGRIVGGYSEKIAFFSMMTYESAKGWRARLYHDA